MQARSVIEKIRDNQVPDLSELQWFATGLADGTVSDAQAGAFAMAVLLNGLGETGRVGLTQAMRDSGQVLNWALGGPVLDKHSTGGVGDCVSLVLAPAMAACGAYVPMISGRGLGHTGGTLDKLESIPGFRTDLSEAQLREVTARQGCAIVSASANIAPADKRLYAVRDVTGTVESLDLITASILSKKLAAGLQGLVLDVKLGTGAFMKTPERARALARALVETANAAGCPTTALITDMNQPLASNLGNALEIESVMQVLCGQKTGPLAELSAALGGVALANAGLCDTPTDGAHRIADAITTGRAAEIFGQMVAAQGGPLQFVENWSRFLPEAPVITEVTAPRSGYVTHINGHALGMVVVSLGGGRMVESDRVNPAVGLSQVVRLGAFVSKGQPLAVVHAAREGAATRASKLIQDAIQLGEAKPDVPDLIHERIG